MVVVPEDCEEASAVLALPPMVSGVRLHKAAGLHPERASLGE